ncbi:hypothetical protein EC973_002950 [Apophysomyces ossiformis]|uniref:Heterokaryon incompatibility domain-containing protein n=1 Tax=Apophysomyces ossiformis TaxID=679940 RepID=A0A8H7BG31_9FUNG|nr:hypothetical protein EC973_002950 [Apophysomyces ossiformis]
MGDIVLLATESTYENIKCMSVPFYGNVPEYYAISYRWGEHHQWRVQTPNYVAFVTSMSRRNLIQLCTLYRAIVPYLWIDTICINQADLSHRKMAIKNMDYIYQRAKKVVAVPNLCYDFDGSRMDWVRKRHIDHAVELMSRNTVEHVYGRYEIINREESRHIKSLPAKMFICEVIEE